MLILKKLTLMLILGLIKIYQVIVSPLCGGCCRFSPTCSAYARQAFLLHGVVKGGKLTLCRLLKCHPWGKSGYDPVPPVESKG